jgi:membrane fusion protein (multidrug efflux system)
MSTVAEQPKSNPVPQTRVVDGSQAGSLKKTLARVVGGVALLAGLVLGVRAWQHGRNWVGTDDAFLNAHVEQVSSRIAGRVESVPVRDNEFVRAGQLLVALDDRDLRVAIQQREAKLASAKADVTKAEAQALAAQAAALQVAAQLESAKAKSDNSEIELNRTKRLRETGAVAQQELDTAEKNELTDRAGVVAGEKQVASLQAGIRYAAAAIEVAKAAVAEAEADLATARLDLSYTTIVAKQEGRVTVKTVEPGNYVQPGQALMAVVSGDVWVEANYKETQLARVRPGQEAVVRVDAYPDLELRGHVDSIQAGSGAQFSLLPPENATGNYVKVVQRVPVKIVLDLAEKDTPTLLGPGMSVVPEIHIRNQ